VEGEIRRGLVRQRMPVSRESLSVASRTDRGVSAVGNAMLLTSELSGPTILRAMNGLSPEIFFTAAEPVPADFRVRRANRRIYRYYEPTPPSHSESWSTVAREFEGRVDVRSLGRGVPVDRPQWRTVESVRVTPSPPGLLVEVRAPSFVWGMVRKIVGALRESDAGRLTVHRLSDALAGRERLTLPMAEPEPLVLWDVVFPIEWTYAWEGPNRHQTHWWTQAERETITRQRVLQAMDAGTELSGR
jgi:tRNA pseudouridine38-40 synthase